MCSHREASRRNGRELRGPLLREAGGADIHPSNSRPAHRCAGPARTENANAIAQLAMGARLPGSGNNPKTG
jgi:hypothetical protein